jgi:hypothetical protein
MSTEQKILLLKQELEKIKKDCKAYETCTDGSYEMCLSHHGYMHVLKEINDLEEGNDLQ